MLVVFTPNGLVLSVLLVKLLIAVYLLVKVDIKTFYIVNREFFLLLSINLDIKLDANESVDTFKY